MGWIIGGIVYVILVALVLGGLKLSQKADGLIVFQSPPDGKEGAMSMRKGDWLQTYTGIHFYPLDPRPEEIDIRDIAHSLALQCRWAGHVKQHYSVAEHCVRASHIVPPADALWALLHDAPEAYLIDLPRPLKNLPEFIIYRITENIIMTAVISQFGLLPHEPVSVRFADDTLLATEARDLMGCTEGWAPMLEPLGDRIIPWGPEASEKAFLERYAELSREEYTPAGAGIPAEV